MKLDIYVNYKGNCREAFKFYKQQLGGKIISMATFKDMPDSSNIPEERKNDILHARIEIGNCALSLTQDALVEGRSSFFAILLLSV